MQHLQQQLAASAESSAESFLLTFFFLADRIQQLQQQLAASAASCAESLQTQVLSLLALLVQKYKY